MFSVRSSRHKFTDFFYPVERASKMLERNPVLNALCTRGDDQLQQLSGVDFRGCVATGTILSVPNSLLFIGERSLDLQFNEDIVRKSRSWSQPAG